MIEELLRYSCFETKVFDDSHFECLKVFEQKGILIIELAIVSCQHSKLKRSSFSFSCSFSRTKTYYRVIEKVSIFEIKMQMFLFI